MRKIFFILCLLVSASALPQRVVNRQSLYWIRYQNQLTLSPSFYWNNEIDNRRFFNPDVENQLICHSHLHFKKGKWDMGTGLTLSWIYAQKPENGFNHSTAEIRPFAEVTFDQPLALEAGYLYIYQQRFGLDEYFMRNVVRVSVLHRIETK